MIHVQRALVLLLFFPVLALAAAPLGFDDARHLLNRTSFAASIDDINAFSRLTRAQAVDQLLASTANNKVATPAPAWSNNFESPRRLRGMSADERKVAQREQFEKGAELRGWWMQEMLVTQTPLTEKMVLFWHNHFVSSLQKVRSPVLMYRQNALLRKHALGYFGDMLHAVARDPAMVIYLDGASNRKGQPNENFAREVMELFTMGEGRYSERDIKEAARAFTGWSIDGETGAFMFRPQAHDNGEKTVLGKTGFIDGGGVLDILLAQPYTAEFIVGKLWREFVSAEPDPVEVKRIAGVFRDSGYNVRSALRAMLLSDAFYAPPYRATLVKSPVELVVGTLRQFQFTTGDVQPFALVVAQLGQNLFSPPNVKGWPGGNAWINSTTLLARKQFLERLFSAAEMRPAGVMINAPAVRPAPAPENLQQRLQRAIADVQFDSEQWLKASGGAPEQVQRVVLAMAPQHAVPSSASALELARRLTQDPVYQLK